MAWIAAKEACGKRDISFFAHYGAIFSPLVVGIYIIGIRQSKAAVLIDIYIVEERVKRSVKRKPINLIIILITVRIRLNKQFRSKIIIWKSVNKGIHFHK